MYAKCHPSERVHGRELCSRCYNRWLRLNNSAYNADCNKRSVAWLANYPRYKANRMALKRYGITLEEVERMREVQKFLCLICNRAKKLVVDHNHVTGKVRGMLCQRCNMLVGFMESNPTLLPVVAIYLERGD